MLKHVFITGLPGSGREGVAKRLAQALGWVFLSVDLEVKREHGEGPEALKTKKGEEFSQTAQLEALKRLGSNERAVISVSSDVVTKAEAWRVMNSPGSLSVFLDASARALARRLSGSPNPPPELVRSLAATARARRPFCEERAGLSLRADKHSEGELISLILWTMPPDYKEVAPGAFVGRGVLLDLADIILDRLGGGRGFAVAGRGSWAFAGKHAVQRLKGLGGVSVQMVDESGVGIESLLELWLKMSRGRADTGSFVISLGERRVHALGLTAASTYLGGIASVAVPTNPLAALDECIAGSCFIKLKNRRVIGARGRPGLLAVDTALLPAGNSRHLLAEAVKLGAVASGELFEFVKAEAKALESGNLDAYEELLSLGVPLNLQLDKKALFGHLAAWALEEARKVSHGEAVAAGMLWEAERLGVPEGVRAQLEEALGALGINPKIEMESTRLRAFMNSTKLTRRGKVLMVKVSEIGESQVVEVESL